MIIKLRKRIIDFCRIQGAKIYDNHSILGLSTFYSKINKKKKPRRPSLDIRILFANVTLVKIVTLYL